MRSEDKLILGIMAFGVIAGSILLYEKSKKSGRSVLQILEDEWVRNQVGVCYADKTEEPSDGVDPYAPYPCPCGGDCKSWICDGKGWHHPRFQS